jgi:hypothetical protein
MVDFPFDISQFFIIHNEIQRTNNDLQNMHKANDRVTRTPLKTGWSQVLRKCSAVPAPLVEPFDIFQLPSVILNLHIHTFALCMFCRSLFVRLSFFFWPLCCLSFELQILITPLVSSKLTSHLNHCQNNIRSGAHYYQRLNGSLRVEEPSYLPSLLLFS